MHVKQWQRKSAGYCAVLLLCMLANTIQAHAAGSNINAVCRITLENGRIYEGAVFLSGGYDHTATNGFYIVDADSTATPILFRPGMQLIRFNPTPVIYFTNGETVAISDAACRDVYFMKDVTHYFATEPQRLRVYAKIIQCSINYFNHNVERFNGEHPWAPAEHKYALLDAITLSPVSHTNIWLIGVPEENIPNRQVRTNEIDSYEILYQPSVYWRNRIAAETAKYKEIAGYDSLEEVGWPDWIHEVYDVQKEYSETDSMLGGFVCIDSGPYATQVALLGGRLQIPRFAEEVRVDQMTNANSPETNHVNDSEFVRTDDLATSCCLEYGTLIGIAVTVPVIGGIWWFLINRRNARLKRKGDKCNDKN